MFQRETADEDRIEQIILQSLRQILEHQDSARFLAWAGEAYPDFLGLSWPRLSGTPRLCRPANSAPNPSLHRPRARPAPAAQAGVIKTAAPSSRSRLSCPPT